VVTVDELEVADPADAWTRAGFSIGSDGQIFFRLGDVVVEVVGSPGTASGGPSTLWGITYVVDDIDATAAFFGDRTTPVKDAVQPGRRITTLHHHALGMSVRSAMISTPARR
jgi:hypothetical protein